MVPALVRVLGQQGCWGGAGAVGASRGGGWEHAWWASHTSAGTSLSRSHSSSAAAASCRSLASADCAESAPRQRATPCSACTGALAPAKSFGCCSLVVAALSCASETYNRRVRVRVGVRLPELGEETCNVESGTSRHSASGARARVARRRATGRAA